MNVNEPAARSTDKYELRKSILLPTSRFRTHPFAATLILVTLLGLGVNGRAQAWKIDADAKIEQIRKRTVHLVVRDGAGAVLPGAVIQVKQRRNEFGFGCALSGTALPNRQYQQFFKDNFEWAVFENETKWTANESAQGRVTFGIADAMADFCRRNGITMRGHTLFWEDPTYVQPWVQALPADKLRAAVNQRILDATGHFRGTFRHWDVDNELLHGHNFYRGRLGVGIIKEMFQKAHVQTPETLLFVNDYNVIEGGDTELYVQQIQDLIKQGTPVAGIGAQGHFFSAIDPVALGQRLDRLASFGLPIWITELDYASASELDRADNLERAFRVAYSKPAVHGILLWGFWAGAHWRGADAALLNSDFTVNAAGRRYQALRAEWSTSATGTTDGDGAWSFRGFHGEYEVTITPPGQSPQTRWLKVPAGTGDQETTLSLVPLYEPTFQPLTQFQDSLALDWEPLIGSVACKLQSSSNLTTWSDLSPVMSPLARSWIDRRPPVDKARFYRVIPSATAPVTFDRDFNLSDGGTSTYQIDGSGAGLASASGALHQVYYWFSAPDLRNGTFVLKEDPTIASPAGGPAGVLNFQIAIKPTVKSGGQDYWGFILPGFSVSGLPLGAVTVSDLAHAELQFRYRLSSGRQINVRLEPTAVGGGFGTRCDFGNLSGNGNWKLFSLKLSQGSNLTAFRNFINAGKTAALQLVFGNGAGLSSYVTGDSLQVDDVLLSYTP